MLSENTEGRGPFALKVLRVVEETPDARSFVLEIPERLSEEFRYRAGQYLTLEMPFESFQINRCYSLSSAPEVDDAPQVTVKRVAEGRMSNLLIDTIRAGDSVRVHRPAGRFLLDEGRGTRGLTLFAGGSGITPVFSILKTALKTSAARVRLLYANRDASSVIFASELEQLERDYGERLEVLHHHDDASGFLSQESVRAWALPAGGAQGAEADDFYLCGPAPFMETVAAALEAGGVPPTRVRQETFVSAVDPDRRERADADLADAAPESAPAHFLVSLKSKITRVPYAGNKTLLAACQDAGVRAPSSCEDGFCGSCMCRLMEGEVDMANPMALTDHDIERGLVLACQARPKSDATLHIDFDSVSFGASKAGEGDVLAPPIPRLRMALVVSLCVAAATLVRWLHTLV